MRIIERWYPLKELYFNYQTKALLILQNDLEDFKGYPDYINLRLNEAQDSLEGTIVHGMTINEYYKKHVDPMIRRLENKFSASSSPAVKK